MKSKNHSIGLVEVPATGLYDAEGKTGPLYTGIAP